MSSLHIAQIHRPWAQCPGRFLIPQPVAPSRNGGLKDKTCWFCSDFSAYWCGKVGVLVGGVRLVPANSASRACVWLPNDRVRGRRGLALALMGVARPIPGAAIDEPPGPCAHGCRNLTLFGQWWGVCSIRSLPSACRRRVASLMVQFPPFAGGEVAVRCGVAAVRGGVAPTAHTTSMKNADNGLPRARRSALWIQRCLASCVARTRTRYCVH